MVTKGIEQCLMTHKHDGYETQCYDCPYFDPDISVDKCMAELRNDTLSLLKELGETELCDRCGRRRLKSNRSIAK